MIRTILFSILLFSTRSVSAQIESPPHKFQWDRVITGGNVGFSFGSETIVDVSPIFGYRFTDRFHAGLGLKYEYYSDNRYVPKFETSIYGGSLFARYFVLENLFLHAEPELTSYERFVYDQYGNPYLRRVTGKAFLVGAGYFQGIGRTSGIVLMVLYDILGDPYSPYSYNPLVIRGGFVVGF